MGAELIMTRLDDLTWNLFAPQVAGARAARERFKRQMRRRFGEEKTSRIAQHAQAAADSEFSPTPSLNVESQAAFWELLVLELRVREIESRIDSAASFYDPYSVWAVLPTLGLSWWNDVLPMVEPPTGQGYMPIRNIKRFLGMVKQANQHLPTRAEIEGKGRHGGSRQRHGALARPFPAAAATAHRLLGKSCANRDADILRFVSSENLSPIPKYLHGDWFCGLAVS